MCRCSQDISNMRILLIALCLYASRNPVRADEKPLAISWDKNFLTIRGEFSGGEIPINYLQR
jgi:hypothetical protein